MGDGQERKSRKDDVVKGQGGGKGKETEATGKGKTKAADKTNSGNEE